MPLHLIKIAVGAETIDDMRRWQKERLAKHGRLFHITRHKPKLEDEILDGGSIYWIIKSFVRVMWKRRPCLASRSFCQRRMSSTVSAPTAILMR